MDSPLLRNLRLSCPASLKTAVQNLRWNPYDSLAPPSNGSGRPCSAAFTRDFMSSASSFDPEAPAVISVERLKPLSSIFSWFPTVISSSLRFRNEMSKDLNSSSRESSSSLLSGSQGISTPVRIPESEHAVIVERYLSASRPRRWKRISSRPASANSLASSGLNGMLVYM